MSDHENGNVSDSGSSASLLNDYKETENLDDETLDEEGVDHVESVSLPSVEGDAPSIKSNQLSIDGSASSIDTDKPAKDKCEWEDLLGSGCLMKKILKEGAPKTRPTRLQTCFLKYKCTLEDETVVEEFNDLKIQLGDCEVVQGLDVAIGLMNVGEICKLKIEPRLAYGSKGLEPLIPPNTTVYFEIELKSVEPEIDPEVLTVSQRKEMGNKKKERGNWWYGRGENTLAIQCYRRALDYLDEVEGGIKEPLKDGESEVTDAELQSLLEDRVSVCNNMAAAQIKMGNYDAALNSLQTVLRCQPNNIKALFRKAKVFRAKNDIVTALNCLQKANEVSPNNVDIQKEITSLQSLLQKQKASERELARRMFNGPKSKSSGDKKQMNDSKKAFLWGTLGLSFAVGLLGFAAYKFKLPSLE